MTFLELCNAVRADANVQGTIPTVVGQTGIFGNIVRWTADAYLDIQAEHDNWKFLWIEDSITLPINYRDVDFTTKNVSKLNIATLRLESNDRYLQHTDWLSFTRYHGKDDSSVTGVPSKFAILPSDEALIRMDKYVAVEDTLHFEATRTAYELTGNTDVPVWKEKWHDLIKHQALISYAIFYNAGEVMQGNQRALAMKMVSFNKEYIPAMYYYTVPFV